MVCPIPCASPAKSVSLILLFSFSAKLIDKVCLLLGGSNYSGLGSRLLGRVQICLVPVVYPIASTSYADFSASSRVIFVGAACSPAVGALPLSFGTSAPLASGIGTIARAAMD